MTNFIHTSEDNAKENGAESGRTNRIGRHLPTSGGLKETLRRAREQECETVQVFVSNPQQWAAPVPRPDAEDFIAGIAEVGLSPVVVHAKYLINLAAMDESKRERSIATLAAELVAAGAIGAELVVVHSGSHGGAGEERGLSLLASGIVEARERAEASADGAKVAEPIVENSCGAGTQLCSDLDSLAWVLDRAGARTCLDTAHAFVAGYDLATPESASEVGEEIREKIGSSAGLIHLNDARNEFGSHRDGHSRIGEGQVPKENWSRLFAEIPGVPVVMETPYDTPEVDAGQIALVKNLVGGLRLTPSGI